MFSVECSSGASRLSLAEVPGSQTRNSPVSSAPAPRYRVPMQPASSGTAPRRAPASSSAGSHSLISLGFLLEACERTRSSSAELRAAPKGSANSQQRADRRRSRCPVTLLSHFAQSVQASSPGPPARGLGTRLNSREASGSGARRVPGPDTGATGLPRGLTERSPARVP
ncbi:hypothetical protein GGR56DRAFT_337200 [Xylariaceae sp. FL0804]|nr:hypothetical protein GGR56DRAFT_337200 [Xylariaceae sp. FL0804]